MKIVEDFLTVQGEARYMGVPSYFVRTTGCNLRCIAKGTDVLMADFSIKKIENIKPDDLIMGVEHIKNGDSLVSRYVVKPQKVKKQWKSASDEDQVIIITNDGKKLQCTKDHQFLTQQKNRPKKWKWKEIQNFDFKQDNLLTMPLVEIKEDSIDYKKGYCVGVVKGDGNITKNLVSFGFVYKPLADWVHKIFTELWGTKSKIHEYRKTTIGNQIYDLRYGNKAFCNYYNNVDILKQNDEFIRGFLAGFFDAEGTNSKGHNCYVCSVHEEELDVVVACFQRLNIAVDRGGWKTAAVSTGECHTVNLIGTNLEKNFNLLKLNIKCKYKIRLDLIYPEKIGATILGVDKKLELYDMETELGNFIANGVVVHNCAWSNSDGTTTKCDTPYTSWNPEKGYDMNASDIRKKLAGTKIKHIVITGGEPTMQKDLEDVTNDLVKDFVVTLETNGTTYRNLPGVFLSISPKTLNSHAQPEDSIAQEMHARNNKFLDTVPKLIASNDYQLKFVYNNSSDEGVIKSLQDRWGVPGKNIYVMPQGISTAQLHAKHADIVRFCLDNGYNFTPRLHIDLFGNTRGT